MPSAPTPRLRFVLEAPGENLNTWGTILNTGAITLIDDAIGGYVSKAVSGNVTLTSANYTADESRMAILDFNSGTGGNVTIPAVSKVYQTRNNTSGNVVITTGSGVSATVESGSLATVIVDGTNVRRMTDAADLSSTLSTANLYTDNAAFASSSGNLPGQSGNGGKFLTTNGSVASWGAIPGLANISTSLTNVSSSLAGVSTSTAGISSSLSSTNLNVTNLTSSLSSTNSNLVSTNAAVANVSTSLTGVSSSLSSAISVNTGQSTSLSQISASLSSTASITTAVSSALAPLTTGTAASAIGYLGIPQTTKAGNYGPGLGDLATELFFTATATATLPANASVAVPIGNFLVVTADAGQTVTLAITTDTLRWPGGGNVTGSRTITGPGFAVVSKKKSGEWWVTGGAGIS
jgi:hypothetical protein